MPDYPAGLLSLSLTAGAILVIGCLLLGFFLTIRRGNKK